MTVSLRRTLVRLAAVAGAGALVLGLAGCGDVDAGSGALDRLHAVVDGWDELDGVNESASNTLPWMGTAEATVIVDPETSDDRLEEMSDRLGAFLAEEDGGTAHWSFLDLQVGTFRLSVDDEAGERSQLFGALTALRGDDRVVGGFIRTSEDVIVEEESAPVFPSSDLGRILGEPSQTIRAIVRDDVPLAEAFGIARSAADGVEDLLESAVVAESEDGRSAVTDSGGADGGISRESPPTRTLGLASAIAAAAPVSDVVATADHLSVRLDRSSDVAGVDAAFASTASRLGITLRVDGGVVTAEEGASSSAIAVARSLDGREGIDAVTVSGSAIAVRLVDAAPVADTISTLLAQAEIGSVDTVTLTSGDDDEPGFSVSAAPDDLGRLGSLVAAAATHPVLSRLIASDDRTELQVTVDPDVESLSSLFTDIRPFVETDSIMSVEAERTSGFSTDVEFFVAEEIVVDLPENASDEITALAEIIERAWAASS